MLSGFHVEQMILAGRVQLPTLQARDNGVGAGPVVRIDVQVGAREAGPPQEKGPPRPNLYRKKREEVLLEKRLQKRRDELSTKERERESKKIEVRLEPDTSVGLNHDLPLFQPSVICLFEHLSQSFHYPFYNYTLQYVVGDAFFVSQMISP